MGGAGGKNRNGYSDTYMRELIKAIIVLPGTVLVLIPGMVLWIGVDQPGALNPSALLQPRFWIGIALAAAGFALAAWTTRLFWTTGKGTPAPWAPPANLVIRGPYRYVRNPMITGVLLILAAESLLLGSWYLFGWMCAFFLLCTLYFTLVEERGLEDRFEDSYRRYKANVPRWIPKWRPWDGP